MSKLQRGAKPAETKKTGITRGAGTIFLALLLLLAAVAAFIFFRDSAPAKSIGQAKTNPSRQDADFNGRCETLHEAIDRILALQSMVVGDVHREEKEAPREKNQGLIRWNARSLLVEGSTAIKPETLRRHLEDGLKKSGGIVLKLESDQYQGYAVTRIDLGFRDQLGGGPLTIISDRIYMRASVQKPIAAAARHKSNPENRAEIGLIIDDFGFRQDMITEFSAIRRSFTFAVLPFKAYSKDAATKGLASGHQVILHLPMEPLSGTEPGEIPSTVQMGMTVEKIRELVERATAGLPGVIGVNNHQGSRATSDRKTMENVMQVLREEKLFFVDSRTHGRTVAADTARQTKIKTTENDLFLDGIADVAYIKKQLRSAGEMALRQGSVTVIGHARPKTAIALREVIPELEAKGIRFVFVSQLVR